MQKLKPIFAWNNYNESTINLLYRDSEGKKKIHHINDFAWYFYIHENELNRPEVKQTLKFYEDKNVIISTESCSPFLKIYCIGDKYFNQVKYLLEKLKSYKSDIRESDLSLTKRYMVDNSIEIEDNLKIGFFDIETDDSNPGISIGRDQILSWAICDNTGKTKFQRLETYGDSNAETELIKNLIKEFIKYDVVASWNGKLFDMPYIVSRIEQLEITTKSDVPLHKSIFWRQFMHIDMMQQAIRMYGSNMTTIGLAGFSLNDVCKFFIGQTKVAHTESIIDLYKNNPEKFEEYNKQDTILLQKLNEKLGIVDLMIKECSWTGTFLNQFYVSELLDNYILRTAKKENIYFKSRPEWKNKEDVVEDDEEEKISIRGGFVMTPKLGLYDNVRVWDFRSLYPSTIITFNIGEDTLVKEISEQCKNEFNEWLGERKIEEVDFKEWDDFLKKENKKHNPDKKYIQTANNQFFRKKSPSLLAGLLKKLLDERKEYKKLQKEAKDGTPEYKNFKASQEAIKILANSLYGILADKKTRYFNPAVAEAITTTGQYINRTSIAIVSKMGYEVLYSDTDSQFLSIGNDKDISKIIEEVNEKLEKYIKKTYKPIEYFQLLQYEKTFRKFAMVDKKRYAGHLIMLDRKETDQVMIKGLETVRKTTIEFARRHINEMLNLILKEDKDENYMKKWITDLKQFVLNEEILPEDLAISIKISKPIADYKSKPIHVLLAEKLIKQNKLLETKAGRNTWGTLISYIITDGSGKKEGVVLDEYKGVWDRKYYWVVQIFSPMQRILEAIWPDGNWREHDILTIEKEERIKAKKKIAEEKKLLLEEKKKQREAKKLTKKQLVLI